MSIIATNLNCVITAALAGIVCVFPGWLCAEIKGPYQADAHTLHLYHFDNSSTTESSKGLVQDDISASTAFTLKLLDGAKIVPSYPGFGEALDTSARKSSRASTLKPLSTATFHNKQSGAFTCEAIVRMDFDPNTFSKQYVDRMQIISLDSQTPGLTRSYHLSFRSLGVLGATAPSLEFVKFAGPEGGPITTLIAVLPQTKPHAPVQGAWFHVAITYNGEEGKDGNFKFYWTRMAPEVTRANLVQSATLERDSAVQQDSTLSIGNAARKKAGFFENWVGQIDEVRISGVARGPNDFLFSKPNVAQAQ